MRKLTPIPKQLHCVAYSANETVKAVALQASCKRILILCQMLNVFTFYFTLYILSSSQFRILQASVIAMCLSE